MAPRLPAVQARAAGCAVTGCARAPSAPRSLLCVSHRNLYYLMGRPLLEEFLASPRVRPLLPRETCRVLACIRMADGRHGLCQAHHADWRAAKAARPGLDQHHWQMTVPAVAEAGMISLRGLAPLVVTEVLYGIQQHTRSGTKISETVLRAVCDELRRQQAAAIAECDPERVRSTHARTLLKAMACHVRRALASPGTEYARDVWDLAVSATAAACPLPASARRGCGTRRSGGRGPTLPRTAAPVPVTSGRPSTAWAGCRAACVPGPTTGTPRRCWAVPTSRTSLAAWPTASPRARSAITAGLRSAGMSSGYCRRYGRWSCLGPAGR